jgi:hypothetical protein
MSFFAGLAVAPSAACAQERLGFALHVGTLVPHAGLTAFSLGRSYTLDGELPLNRTFAIGMMLGVEHPRGGPRLIAANTPPDANDVGVFPLVLPFVRAYGPGSRVRPFAVAGIGYAGLVGQVAYRDTFDLDSGPFATAAVGGGVQVWAARTLAVELTYRLDALRAKGTMYAYSVIALGGRFRLPPEAP